MLPWTLLRKCPYSMLWFIYFGDQPSVICGLVKIFYHSVGCCFVLFSMLFILQKLFSFRKSHLLIVPFSVCVTGVIFRKWSPVSMHWMLLPTSSSVRFNVTGFILGSWSSWTRVLCMVIDMIYLQSSTCWHPVIIAPFVKDPFFFPLYQFGFFIKNQVFKVCELISGSSIQFHWSMCWFYGNTKLFLLLQFYSRPWSQGCWYLQKFIYCAGLF